MPSNIKHHSQLFRHAGKNEKTARVLGPLLLKPNDEFPSNRDAQIVSGSLHIHNRLLAAGYDPINPDSLIAEKDRAAIVSQIAEIAIVCQSHLESRDCPVSMRYALLAEIIALGFSLSAANCLQQHLENLELETFIGWPQKSFTSARRERPNSLLVKLDRMIDNNVLFSRPFLINLNSQSGKKFADEGARHIHLSFDKASTTPLKTAIGNKLQLFKTLSPGTRLRYKLRPLVSPESASYSLGETEGLFHKLQEITTSDVARLIVKRLIETVSEYNNAFHTTGNWLQGITNPPTKAQFNNAGSITLAAMGHALAETGVAIDFFSHGAMVSHGSADRSLLTEILSRSIYNEPDYAAKLLPRSPLQISNRENTSKIVKKIRVSGSPDSAPRSDKDRPFKIYFAPNFLSWFVCFHGMTQSCFEAEFCIRKLVETVRQLPDVELYLRIKTTVQDNAKRTAKLPNRGLLPDDVKDVFDPENGIIDATHGSHQKYLNDSDLVVTEGATAVMFEALENRKPVLFLNRDVSREPSLPSIRLPGSIDIRGSCYTASAMEDLGKVITLIKSRHKYSPLTNAELSSTIWI